MLFPKNVNDQFECQQIHNFSLSAGYRYITELLLNTEGENADLLCSKGIVQFIPDPFDNGDDLPFVDPSYFLPDVADMRVDRAGVVQHLRAPGKAGDILP